MDTVQERRSGDDAPKTPPLRPIPTTTGEYINVLAHFHRAEMGRMAGWRDRIDRTTNWAITVAAAMLSISLSTPTAHHGVLLFAMLLILLLLSIEARRYRFFDVYRARVRLLERNHFAPIFAAAENEGDWAAILSSDLRRPQFLMTHRTAMSRRLRRNYIWMFLILLLAWVLKISTPKLQDEGVQREFARSFYEVLDNASLGPVPGWAILLAVGIFYAWLAYTARQTEGRAGELAHGEVHV